MSTRSRIGLQLKDGSIKSIYCHYDGYISHQKPLLEQFYNNYEAVEKLVNIGDISILGKEYDEAISKKYWSDEGDFRIQVDTLQSIAKDMTLAYKDRGEKNIEPRIDENLQAFVSRAGDCGEEFAYVFKPNYDGIYEWFYTEVPMLLPLDTAED